MAACRMSSAVGFVGATLPGEVTAGEAFPECTFLSLGRGLAGAAFPTLLPGIYCISKFLPRPRDLVLQHCLIH